MDKPRGLKDRHPPIGDVRGIGLMIGIEIVRDRDTHAPAGAERERIVRGAFEKGLLTLPCGKSTIRLSPPLVCTDADKAVAMRHIHFSYIDELVLATKVIAASAVDFCNTEK